MSCGDYLLFLDKYTQEVGLYIYQHASWPKFTWDVNAVGMLLADVRHRQGRILGQMNQIGFNTQLEASLVMLTMDVVKSSEIEGEILKPEEVRSSIARKLGLDIEGLVPSDRNVDGVVEMMLDASQNREQPLSEERLFSWHGALFPTGRSGMHVIVVAGWRNNVKEDPMQVVSGAMGKERVHFQAPDSIVVNDEMTGFISWFNNNSALDLVLKAAIAHLWFLTIHPFDDGNGRIARAITDMQLARADQTKHRFYSMSTQIRKDRKQYYQVLEATQKGNLDITSWLLWFLNCMNSAIEASEGILTNTLKKALFWQTHSTTIFNDRQRRMVNMLFDGFEGNLNSSKWAKITKSSQDTAARDINQLISLGVLSKSSSGGRSTSYELTT